MKKFLMAIILISGLIILSGTTQAGTVTFLLDHTISGDTPIGGPDWVTVKFEDVDENNPGTVKVTIETNLTGDDFMSRLYFNVNPDFDPTTNNLTFSKPTGTYEGSIDFTFNKDSYNIGGGGKFDILFGAETSGGTNNDRFANKETITFTITGDGLTADDFNFFSSDQGDNGNYYAAAHIQDTDGPKGSGKIGNPVPIPGAAWLLGSGMIGFVALRRRLGKKKTS